MKKYINKICLLMLFVLTFSLVGCMPKGDPSEVLNKYYQFIKAGNPEEAYETLSEASKKNFSKEDFVKWSNTKKELASINDTKLEKANEYKDKDLDGIKFKNVVEFNVTEKNQSFYANKEETFNYKRNVVNDNGTWKVYRDKENGKQRVAESLTELAWLYADGKGNKSKDLIQAATILDESLKYDKELPEAYYALAYVYSDLERYDEAIATSKQFIEKTKDDKEKSNGYNLLGTIYQDTKVYDEAKKYFDESLKFNPDNQYAKTNLEKIKKLN